VGKTLSARHYAGWDRVEATNPYAAFGDFRSDGVPGNGCVLFTARGVNSPRQIEDDVARLFQRMHKLVRQAIHTEAEPGIAAAQRKLKEEQEHLLLEHDWFSGPSERLRQAKAAVSKAILDRANRDRGACNPTDPLLVDEVDWVKTSGLEDLRAIFEGCGLGLIRIGMAGLERRLARYAQLYSRIGFVHEFRPLGAPEVRTLLEGWRPRGVMLPDNLLADDDGVAAIIRVTGGNFRLLDRLLTQVGRILELNGLKLITRRTGHRPQCPRDRQGRW
jgi:hypothetical protein